MREACEGSQNEYFLEELPCANNYFVVALGIIKFKNSLESTDSKKQKKVQAEIQSQMQKLIKLHKLYLTTDGPVDIEKNYDLEHWFDLMFDDESNLGTFIIIVGLCLGLKLLTFHFSVHNLPNLKIFEKRNNIRHI